MKNVNKEMFINALIEKTDFSKKDTEAMLDAFVEVVTSILRKGDKLTLTGFGTFRTSARAARDGINPQTKEKIKIAATTVPKFTAGKTLKEAVK
jgi:DNA-binding protein HU-beta